METIPIEKCKNRFLYRVKSRNFKFGVFDKRYSSFIGLAREFRQPCLSEEFHRERKGHLGSVYPKEELEKVPDNLSIDRVVGTFDENTWRPIKSYVPEGGKEIWYFKDTCVSSEKISPLYLGNRDLLTWLIKKEREYKL